MKYSILIAEDDESIVDLLSLYLQESYDIYSANDGLEALQVLKDHDIDLALVDIMMPRLNGYELIERIREHNNIPIIVVSAKVMEQDRIKGLDIGADAYITKPFNPSEVVAYVNATLRRYHKLGNFEKNEHESKFLHVGEIGLDTENHIVIKGEAQTSLTSAEYKILYTLMKTPGKIYTKKQLYECINGDSYLNDDNTIMVHMSNLRGKVEDNPSKPVYIKTVRGIGYKIEDGQEKK